MAAHLVPFGQQPASLLPKAFAIRREGDFPSRAEDPVPGQFGVPSLRQKPRDPPRAAGQPDPLGDAAVGCQLARRHLPDSGRNPAVQFVGVVVRIHLCVTKASDRNQLSRMMPSRDAYKRRAACARDAIDRNWAAQPARPTGFS